MKNIELFRFGTPSKSTFRKKFLIRVGSSFIFSIASDWRNTSQIFKLYGIDRSHMDLKTIIESSESTENTQISAIFSKNFALHIFEQTIVFSTPHCDYDFRYLGIKIFMQHGNSVLKES